MALILFVLKFILAVLNACNFSFFLSGCNQHVLLGAVPFPSDVLRLKELGVCGVVTLNESYERLVPKSLYEVSDQVHPN